MLICQGVKRMTRARFKNLGLGLKPGSDVLAIQDRLERSLGCESPSCLSGRR